MKKRIFGILLVLLFLFSACESNITRDIEKPFVFYYLNEYPSESGTMLYAQTISLDVEAMSFEQIFDAYLKSDAPESTKSAFSSSWRLKSVQIEDRVASVAFSGARLSEIEDYLAAACLTKTLSQLSYVETVCLYVPGKMEAICLAERDILLEDTAMMPQEETIALYLPDQEHRYLVKQLQTVEAMDSMEKTGYILQELLNADSCIPQGTQLLEFSVDNGLCKIDLSSEFVTGMEKRFATERLAVCAIVNSLTELPEITTVDIWIEGTPLDKLEFFRLPVGLEHDDSILASYAQTTDDVDLYLSCDGESLVCVPYQIVHQGDLDPYQMLITALIESESAYGVKNYIPKGTKLLNLRMEESACIVDLSGEFLSECKSAKEEIIAVYSIVATLCGANKITAVEILVEGLEPDYRNEWLKNVRQAEASWFAEQ